MKNPTLITPITDAPHESTTNLLAKEIRQLAARDRLQTRNRHQTVPNLALIADTDWESRLGIDHTTAARIPA